MKHGCARSALKSADLSHISAIRASADAQAYSPKDVIIPKGYKYSEIITIFRKIEFNHMKRLFLIVALSSFASLGLSSELSADEKADSVAFVSAQWQMTDLGKGAVAMSAQLQMFNSMQNICVVKYPLKKFTTEILHRPGKTAGKPSEIGKAEKALFAVNAGYFHMKQRIPSVYFRTGKEIHGYSHPTELYRVDALMGFKDKKGRKVEIAPATDTTKYAQVSKGWKQAMASGPLLILDGEMMVPVLMGNQADGANVAAMEKEQKEGYKHRTHYTSALFYDKRHPRAAFGTDEDGNAYLVVIDGRFPGQADGASIYETAYVCYLLGMTDAINLDGGGSTTLWTETTGVINYPCDNKTFDHDGERTVPNLIIVK